MSLLTQIRSFLIVLFISSSIVARAQSAVDQNVAKFSPYTSPVLLKHYSTAELHAMETSDTLKFKTIIYYYTQSYIATPFSCIGCNTFVPEQFDVFEYERFRKKSSRYHRVWTKYGFELTLLSIDELKYKLPIHTAIH